MSSGSFSHNTIYIGKMVRHNCPIIPRTTLNIFILKFLLPANWVHLPKPFGERVSKNPMGEHFYKMISAFLHSPAERHRFQQQNLSMTTRIIPANNKDPILLLRRKILKQQVQLQE